ncbi:hypothetical protein [Sulfurimonas lithotrophica]|uniref:hypothetical protein n=1 Tax=Sulfurimonas lithotrophica TaxID=2590022 RepID=UPI001F52A7F7|nr:hypothetical protein [Sulfurimonas lithotrophica]
MVRNIDWGEFKSYRASSTKEQDNFLMMLDFLKSYYNLYSVFDIYDTLAGDETTKMMLDKRDITSPEGLESYLFKAV